MNNACNVKTKKYDLQDKNEKNCILGQPETPAFTIGTAELENSSLNASN